MHTNKEMVLNLLENIQVSKFIGQTDVETINYALARGLLERTELGNFGLSSRGRRIDRW